MGKKKVAAHKTVRSLLEVVNYPEHDERTESKMFKETKKRLKKDGHYQCYVCGSAEKLQVHHYGGEWALENDVDYDLLKVFLEEWDVYGYGKLLKNNPITSVDDVRNAMVLCQEHHTGGSSDGAANGIHNITFPAWISQKISKKGSEPVPMEDPELAKE
jgi:hypothetical protein